MQEGESVPRLGILGPLDEATARVWLSALPTPQDADLMTLTHAEGLGKIDFETVPIPPGFLRRHAQELYLAFLSLVLLWSTVSVGKMAYSGSKIQKKE